MERSKDWFRQAEFDLSTAKILFQNNNYSYTCFIAHQCVEKALKSLLEKLDNPSWGHDLIDLFNLVKEHLEIINQLEHMEDICALLNLYYIPTRYPDAFSSGAPADKFTKTQADQAIQSAEEVLKFVRNEIFETSDEI